LDHDIQPGIHGCLHKVCTTCLHQYRPVNSLVTIITHYAIIKQNILQLSTRHRRGWHPLPPLRTAYRLILVLRTAFRHFLASRTAYRLTNKKNHFGRFHLHKEVKITVCCMHMYSTTKAKLYFLCTILWEIVHCGAFLMPFGFADGVISILI